MSLNLPLNEYVDDRTFHSRRNIQLQVNIYLSGNVIAFNEAINFCDILMLSLNIKTSTHVFVIERKILIDLIELGTNMNLKYYKCVFQNHFALTKNT